MNNNFFDPILSGKTAEVANKKQNSTTTEISCQEDDFKKKFCIRKMDEREFLKKCALTDNLIFVLDEFVVGKGVRCEIDCCALFIEQEGQKFAYNIVPEHSWEKYNAIPRDIMVVVTDQAKDVFIILPDENDQKSVYLLNDDAKVSLYIETMRYQNRNAFYICAVKNVENDFCHCFVTASPVAVDGLFSIFINSFD